MSIEWGGRQIIEMSLKIMANMSLEYRDGQIIEMSFNKHGK